MTDTKRATVNPDPGPPKARRPRALTEDAADLTTANQRAEEPTLRFEDVLADLKQRGKL
jgi:hypothetical protein